MKILLVADEYKGSCGYYYKNNLEKMGHKVKIFDYRKSLLPTGPKSLLSRGIRYFLEPQFTKTMNRHFLKEIDAAEPDLVFAAKAETLSKETVLATKDRCKIINWWFDPIVSFAKPKYVEAASEYDIFFAKDPLIVNKLKTIGCNNTHYLPEGYDHLTYGPKTLSDENKQKYGADVSMIGYQYPYRLKFLSNIKTDKMKVWGKITGDISTYSTLKEKYEDRFISIEEKNNVFNASKINLNLHHLGEVGSINVRAFEIPGAGGFQLSDRMPRIDEFFVEDKEICLYDGPKDLQKKIEYYLSDEDARNKITKAGHIKAKTYHKTSDRLKVILDAVKKL